MAARAWWQWLMAVTRWSAIKLSKLIRLLFIVLIAVGMGIAATQY